MSALKIFFDKSVEDCFAYYPREAEKIFVPNVAFSKVRQDWTDKIFLYMLHCSNARVLGSSVGK